MRRCVQIRFELEDDRMMVVEAHRALEAAQRIGDRYRVPALMSPDVAGVPSPEAAGIAAA